MARDRKAQEYWVGDTFRNGIFVVYLSSCIVSVFVEFGDVVQFIGNNDCCRGISECCDVTTAYIGQACIVYSHSLCIAVRFAKRRHTDTSNQEGSRNSREQVCAAILLLLL